MIISFISSDNGFKSTVVNRNLPYLYTWLLKITLTFPLRNKFITAKSDFLIPTSVQPDILDF